MSSTSGLFIRKDGSWTSAMVFLILSIPCLLFGRWNWAITSLVASLLLALCNATHDIQEEDKQEIKFNILEPHDVLREMVEWEELVFKNEDASEEQVWKGRLVITVGLTALAKKFGKKKQPISLLCQQAAYIGLRNFPIDDEVVAPAISLLALVAKDEEVQKRHQFEADVYGLDLPLKCITSSLERAQELSGTRLEQRSAELQRKSCLWLGALATTPEMAGLVVQEGGLKAILEALDWFRFHADVANWGLWALFTIAYENYSIKTALVQLNAISVVIQSLRNCSDHLEVVRHGIAILFDLLREDQDRPAQGKLDVWKIRVPAVEAGLHEVVVRGMENFPSEMDIIMMGQDVLLGTGFDGDIPSFQLLG